MNIFYIFLLILSLTALDIKSADNNKSQLSQETLEKIKNTSFQDHEKFFRESIKFSKATPCPAFFTILMNTSTDQDINSIFEWLADYPDTLVKENVNAQNKNGSTLLHLYVARPPAFYEHPITQSFSKPPKLEKLFMLNANMYMKNCKNNTPLNIAINCYNNFADTHKQLSPRSFVVAAALGAELGMKSYELLIDQLATEHIKQGAAQKRMISQ